MAKDLRVSFRLKAGRDDDLISWLENITANDRSYYIREALRGCLSKVIPKAAPLPGNPVKTRDARIEGKKINNKPVDKVKPISEISEAELEKNLRGWMD